MSDRCQGIAKSTGKQCIHRGSNMVGDDSRYCHQHQPHHLKITHPSRPQPPPSYLSEQDDYIIRSIGSHLDPQSFGRMMRTNKRINTALRPMIKQVKENKAEIDRERDDQSIR